MANLKLISFELCPYVQRSVISLLHKKVPFEVEFIDLSNKPKWFLDISPLGKVPALVIDGKDVLFESAVINEYLDESYSPRLLPTDPLGRAKQRGWIEVSSFLIGLHHQTMIAKDENEFKEKLEDLKQRLKPIEERVMLPYFDGDHFSLVDTSMAPFFIRLNLLKKILPENSLTGFPKLEEYYQNLMGVEAVQKSLPENFEEKLFKYFKDKPDNYIGRKLSFSSTVFR